MSEAASSAETLAAAIADLDVDRVTEILRHSPHLASETTTRDEEAGETMVGFAITQNSVQSDKAAVSDDQLAIIRALLAAGAGLEVTSPSGGMFPLGTAAWLGKLAIVELLLAVGADVNGEPIPTDTAIEVAADHRHAAVVERLIQAGAAHTAKTLVQAGLLERLRVFLDDDPEAVNRPVHLGHLNGVYGPPLLALVEEYGFADPHLPDVARLLIARGADVTIPGSDGKTALQRAQGKRVACEQAGSDTSYTDEVIQLLIDNGAVA